MAKRAEILEIPATITSRGQTTVPAAIRRMLRLGQRDQVVFRGLTDGTVVIARKEGTPDEGDPAMTAFLKFLAMDMTAAPRQIRPVSRKLIERGRALVEGIDVDIDAPLPDDGA